MATGYTADGQPSRPYSSAEMTGGNAGRTGEFTTGQVGDPGNAASVTSLSADSERFNAMVPRQFQQTSVLQTAVPSANGISQGDYDQRMLPGSSPSQAVMLPTANGSSQDSYNKSILMRLWGENTI